MIRQGEIEGMKTIRGREKGEQVWTAVAREMSSSLY